MSAENNAPLLEVKNLVTRFQTESGTVFAVNDVSYTLNMGESMAIVGESGSGKSVSVLSLLRLIPSPPGRIAGGQVLFNGRDLLAMKDKELRRVRGKEVGLILQDPMTALNPILTVKRQLTEATKIYLGLSAEQATQHAAEMLRLVGLPNPEDRLDDYPHQFSGGQRQRLMIAMALSTHPSLLIADEPTTALDVTIQAQIVALVKELQRKLGMGIIWITHDLALIAGLVEKVAVMYAGSIVEMAPIRSLYKQTSHPYTLGLLQSLPVIIDDEETEKIPLVPIEGAPPDLLEEPRNCAFAPRCRFAVAKCYQEKPPLRLVDIDHYTACWRAEEVRAIHEA